MPLLHLVGHDGTAHGDDALALARTIGGERDVVRTVVHVLALAGPTTVADEAWLATLPAGGQAHLERVRASLAGDERLEVVLAASPARGLTERAEQLQADLIAVGARSWDPLGLAIAPVAGRLLSGGPCTVAHAPVGYASGAHPLRRIVVGYDRSEEAGDALAEAAVVAAAAGAHVDVVCAHDPVAHLGYPGVVAITPQEAAAAQETAEGIASEGLQALPEAVRGSRAGRPGAAGAVLDAFAEEQHADLVILGSRGYGPLRRVLLGSTSSHVLRHCTRPVVVLPRGTGTLVPELAHAALAVAVAP